MLSLVHESNKFLPFLTCIEKLQDYHHYVYECIDHYYTISILGTILGKDLKEIDQPLPKVLE